MKEVLISIRPEWCRLIANGKKTVEVRKTRPKLETPFKCYIYCTRKSVPIRDTKYKVDGKFIMYYDELAITDRYGQGKRFENPYGVIMDGETSLNGKVIGEFVCDYTEKYESVESKIKGCVEYQVTLQKLCEEINMSINEFCSYGNGKLLYGWHISNLKIYDKPKDLSEFKKINRECWYADLGLAKRDCPECKNEECYVSRAPQSWCYIEGVIENDKL